jgi:hypothetical protein
MSIFYVLICVVSLALRSPISLNIHNQFQGFNLTSPVSFIHGGRWHVAPSQEIDVNAIMRSHLRFDSEQDILEGALVYRVPRQYAEFDESAQEKLKDIQLLVVWRVEYARAFHVRALLVEHDKDLDEDKLWQLHQKYWHLLETQVETIENDWLLNDATALKTAVNVMNEGHRWDISISEGIGDNVNRPLWIDTTK